MGRYTILFCLMIIVAEVSKKYFLKWALFLTSWVGKGLFQILYFLLFLLTLFPSFLSQSILSPLFSKLITNYKCYSIGVLTLSYIGGTRFFFPFVLYLFNKSSSLSFINYLLTKHFSFPK